IANYSREHGWQTGAPVMADVELDPDPTFVMDTKNLSLNETIASLAAQGVETRSDLPASTPAMLVFAEQSDGPDYRVGFDNFQVIMRYNRSPRYAMAVHDLAEAVAERVRSVMVAPPAREVPVVPTASQFAQPLPTAPQVTPEAARPTTAEPAKEPESGDSSAAETAAGAASPEPAPSAPSERASSEAQTPSASTTPTAPNTEGAALPAAPPVSPEPPAPATAEPADAPDPDADSAPPPQAQ